MAGTRDVTDPGEDALRPRPAWTRRLGPLLLVLVLAANGGTLRVAGAVMGAYRVSVYTDPTPPRPDSVDVSVLVVREDDPVPVDGLDVTVTARYEGPADPPGAPGDGAARGGGAASDDAADDARPRVVTVTADRAQADDPRYYAAKFSPGIAGEWSVEVSVSGPEGSGSAAFTLDVREPGLLDRPWVVVALALLPLALLAWWLVRSDPGAGDAAPGARPGRDASRGSTPG